MTQPQVRLVIPSAKHSPFINPILQRHWIASHSHYWIVSRLHPILFIHSIHTGKTYKKRVAAPYTTRPKIEVATATGPVSALIMYTVPLGATNCSLHLIRSSGGGNKGQMHLSFTGTAGRHEISKGGSMLKPGTSYNATIACLDGPIPGGSISESATFGTPM